MGSSNEPAFMTRETVYLGLSNPDVFDDSLFCC